jgi:hypothetical protein
LLYNSLDPIEHYRSPGEPVHTVLDTYIARKHPMVHAWRARPLRRTFQFTPPSASWLDAAENFFSKMTRQCVRWSPPCSRRPRAGIKRYLATPRTLGWIALAIPDK